MKMNSKKTGKQQKNIQKRLPLLLSLRDGANMLHLAEGYQIYPSRDYIFSNKFRVNGLSISFQGTSIKWEKVIDLSQLLRPLSEIIFLGEKEVEVYPDQLMCKPKLGRELNQPCIATLTLTSKKPFKSLEKMQKSCKEKNCQLVGADLNEKKIHIEIPHFTKYTFDVDDEEEVNENTLDLIMRREAQRLAEIAKSSQVLKKQPQISRALVKKVESHNQKKDHKGCRAAVLHGDGALFRSYKLQNKQTGIIFSQLPHKQAQGKILSFLAHMISNPQTLNSHIIDESQELEVRAYLSLYVICFDFEVCRFQFVGNGGHICFRIGAPQLNEQTSYLKKWFEWTLNVQNQGGNSDLLSCLSLRQVEQHVYHCLKYRSFNDAEFLASIEDPYFRIDDSQRKLSPDLIRIQVGDQKVWKGWGWMKRVATLLWYYPTADRQSILNVMKEEGAARQPLYFMMIWMFYGGNSFEMRNIPENCSGFCWHLAQKNSDRLEKMFGNPLQYRRYRQRLFITMLTQAPDSHSIADIYQNQSYLSPQDKRSLLKNFLRQHWHHPHYHHPCWQDIIWELEAYNKYVNKQYLQAFMLFVKTYKVHPCEQVERMMVMLVGTEQLLGSGDEYRRETVVRLMQEVGEMDNQEWKALLQWGNICIKGSMVTEYTFQQIQKCCQALGKSTAHQLMQSLFTALKKDGFRQILYNQSLYKLLLKAYSSSRPKSTQIRLARLSL